MAVADQIPVAFNTAITVLPQIKGFEGGPGTVR
jgi:hypothetical protein